MDEATKKRIKEDTQTQYGFIPNQLVVEHKPEYSRFPLNILFAKWKLENGNVVQGLALYEPDLSSFREWRADDGTVLGAKMFYNNRYSHDSDNKWYISIFWDGRDSSYVGSKYRDGELVARVTERGWTEFFAHFTALGLEQGEQCRFGSVD